VQGSRGRASRHSRWAASCRRRGAAAPRSTAARRAPVSSQLFLCCSCHPRRRPLSCIAGRTPTRSLLPFTPLSPLAFLSGRDDWASASAALRQVPRSAQGLRFISSLCFLDLSLLPCSSFPGGDDWASGGAICPVFAQPFAGRAHPPGMPAPSLSFCCARRSTPTLTKLFVFGSASGYNILPTNSDFVCKNYRVYMCTPVSYAGSAPALRGVIII
jgi:hypothetical protein